MNQTGLRMMKYTGNLSVLILFTDNNVTILPCVNRSGESDALDSLDVNAILGDGPSTSRHSSDANTASLKSSTTEAFNRYFKT